MKEVDNMKIIEVLLEDIEYDRDNFGGKKYDFGDKLISASIDGEYVKFIIKDDEDEVEGDEIEHKEPIKRG